VRPDPGGQALEPPVRRVRRDLDLGDAGQVAGRVTQVEVAPDEPDWMFQGLTAVVRAHRGHRLGLLVKLAMLEWLAEAEPQRRWMITGNAETNEHMIAINEALGYQPFGRPVMNFEVPAADVLPAGQS